LCAHNFSDFLALNFSDPLAAPGASVEHFYKLFHGYALNFSDPLAAPGASA
jgi:hypothetical protein